MHQTEAEPLNAHYLLTHDCLTHYCLTRPTDQLRFGLEATAAIAFPIITGPSTLWVDCLNYVDENARLPDRQKDELIDCLTHRPIKPTYRLVSPLTLIDRPTDHFMD